MTAPWTGAELEAMRRTHEDCTPARCDLFDTPAPCYWLRWEATLDAARLATERAEQKAKQYRDIWIDRRFPTTPDDAPDGPATIVELNSRNLLLTAELAAARAEDERLRGALEAARATLHKLSGGVPDRVLAAELAAGRATINAALAATSAATAPDLLAGAGRESDRLHEARIRDASNPESALCKDPQPGHGACRRCGACPRCDGPCACAAPDPTRAVVEAAAISDPFDTFETCPHREKTTVAFRGKYRCAECIAEWAWTVRAAVAALGRTT